MSFPLATITRSTVTLARKSALLAHISSGVPTSPTPPPQQHTRALTSSGSGPSVSSLSSATFLGASLAARKLVESSSAEKKDGDAAAAASSEVHGYLKAALQGKQKSLMDNNAKVAKEEPVDPAAY